MMTNDVTADDNALDLSGRSTALCALQAAATATAGAMCDLDSLRAAAGVTPAPTGFAKLPNDSTRDITNDQCPK